MVTPPRSRSPLLIYHPITGQQFSPRRIPERPANHPGMARPPRQGRNITICSHLPVRNLANYVQHFTLKRPSLHNRHSIRIILHLSKNAPLGTVPFGSFLTNEPNGTVPNGSPNGPNTIPNGIVRFCSICHRITGKNPTRNRFNICINHIHHMYHLLKSNSQIQFTK